MHILASDACLCLLIRRAGAGANLKQSDLTTLMPVPTKAAGSSKQRITVGRGIGSNDNEHLRPRYE